MGGPWNWNTGAVVTHGLFESRDFAQSFFVQRRESLLHSHAATLPLFCRAAKKTHTHTLTAGLLSTKRKRLVSLGRAEFRCDRHANTWTSVSVCVCSLCVCVCFSLLFLFLAREDYVEIKQELRRIQCMLRSSSSRRRSRASAMQVFLLHRARVSSGEKRFHCEFTRRKAAADNPIKKKKKIWIPLRSRNISKCTLSHMILELKCALMTQCTTLNNPDDMHQLIHCFLHSHQRRWY